MQLAMKVEHVMQELLARKAFSMQDKQFTDVEDIPTHVLQFGERFAHERHV